MVNSQQDRLFIVTSYLVWGFTVSRWVTGDMTQSWHLDRWIIVPLIVYGVSLGISSWLTRGRLWWVAVYLVLQASLVFVLAFQSSNVDYFYLLLLAPAGRAILSLPKRQAYVLVGLFSVVEIMGLIVMKGWPNAISFISVYSATLIFTVGFSGLMVQAYEARQETQRLLVEVQEYSEQAQQLAIVEERNRLARELHDSVTQALYGLALQSEAIARELESDRGNLQPDNIREMRDIALLALQEMRLMIFELRPTILEEEGLIGALQARLEAVENRSGIRTSLKSTIDEPLELELENGLYGIAREALNNISKHAHAQQVDISLVSGHDDIRFEIVDDGIGLDPKDSSGSGGLGLKGMEERAANLGATLSVESQPDGGTRVRVIVKR